MFFKIFQHKVGKSRLQVEKLKKKKLKLLKHEKAKYFQNISIRCWKISKKKFEIVFFFI